MLKSYSSRLSLKVQLLFFFYLISSSTERECWDILHEWQYTCTQDLIKNISKMLTIWGCLVIEESY